MLRLVSTVDQFDRCTIGCGSDGEEPFCGQIAAVYVFAEAINQQQANAMYYLGPNYQSTFRHKAECDLSDAYKKVYYFEIFYDFEMIMLAFFEVFKSKKK